MKLNPEHPVVQELDNQWHKLLAISMHKLGYDRIAITEADVEAVASMPEMLTVVAHAHKDAIELLLMTETSAREYASLQGEKL